MNRHFKVRDPEQPVMFLAIHMVPDYIQVRVDPNFMLLQKRHSWATTGETVSLFSIFLYSIFPLLSKPQVQNSYSK